MSATQPASEQHISTYCTPCHDKLLSWKKVDNPTFDYSFHSSLAEFIDCAKNQCRLCSYLCGLFGQQLLHDFILSCPLEHGDPTVDIWNTSQAGWDGHLDEHERLKYTVMAICLRHPAVEGTRELRRDFTVCTSAARAFNRPIWSSTTTIGFDARCLTIREWIAECDTHHHHCREKPNPDTPIAARILSIQRLGPDEFAIKLVPTKTFDLHKENYFVLSHVWGDVQITCKTRLNNIAQHEKEGVDYEKMPPTFKDAVRITATVGVRYLWIDSLCIIQDDEDDWGREAAKMAAIFRFASLTISATSAINSLGGCNLSPITELATHFPRSSDELLDFAIRGPGYEDKIAILQDQMRNSALNTRAWVFQEQILSPRTLHATHSQLVWQCASLIESEDGIQCENDDIHRNVRWQKLDRHPERISPSKHAPAAWDSHPYQLESKWWAWVAEYMKRTLKYGSDQYAAMAGVIRLYQELSNNVPILGLWQRDLALHLPWYVFRHEGEHEVALPAYGSRRPSWTWMSYPHGSVGIYGPWLDWPALSRGPRPHDIGIVYQATTLTTDISWSKGPLTSQPSGTLTIRGIYSALPRPRTHGHGFRARKLYLDPDVPETVQAREAFETVALVAYVKAGGLTISPPSLLTFYLVVEPVGVPEENRYMRIGSMQVFRELRIIEKKEYEPQGTWRDIVLV